MTSFGGDDKPGLPKVPVARETSVWVMSEPGPTGALRKAQPEEVAPAYVFFASENDSSYITGEVLTLLGGETTAA
jgi:NAD(P)-dependent dehydrogenase (short-subunit alcohol dehydrogenase family)